MKALQLFFLSALTLLPATAQEDAPSRIIGEDITSARNTGPEQFFTNIRETWLEDIMVNREEAELFGFSDEELRPALEALEEYLSAARAAYDAQMELALYSLAPIKDTHPQKYTATLQQYRNALMALYLQDARIMRNNSCLTPSDRAPKVTPPQDAFCDAILARAERSDLGGAGYRGFAAQSVEVVKQQHKIKQDIILRLLDAQYEFSFGNKEFFTCTELEGIDQEEYQRERAAKFQAAEQAWETYSWAAARLHCPLPQFSGTGTGSIISAKWLELARNHEKWFTLLMNGM